MRNIIISTMIFVCAVVLAEDVSAGRKPLILTSTSDIAVITNSIAGDTLDVVSVMEEGTEDPTFLVPSRKVILRAKEADFFLKIGNDLEEKWEKRFHREVENSDISVGGTSNIVVTTGVRVAKTKPADPNAQPMIHKDYNPFVWLDPLNGKDIGRKITDFLVSMYPQNAKLYKTNLKAFSDKIDEKLLKWTKLMAPYKGAKVIAKDNSFDYFAKRFGLKIVDYLDPAPGVPANNKRIEYIVEKIKKEKIGVLVIPIYVNPRISAKIAEQTGIEIAKLPTSVGYEWIEEYFQLFDYITRNIHQSMSKAADKAEKKDESVE